MREYAFKCQDTLKVHVESVCVFRGEVWAGIINTIMARKVLTETQSFNVKATDKRQKVT